MADELQISTRDELKKFLSGRPPEVSRVIAARCALRVLPWVVPNAEDRSASWVKPLTLASFRATLVAQSGASTADAYAAAANAAVNAVNAANAAYAAYAANAAANAAYTAANVANAAATSAANAAEAAYYAAAALKAFWRSVKADCRLLSSESGNGLETGDIKRLSAAPLWFERNEENTSILQPALPSIEDSELDIGIYITAFKDHLEALGPDWLTIWDWYRCILQGERAPTEFAKIANETPEFWGDGDDNPRTPDGVMSDIAERIRGVRTIDVDAQDVRILDFTPKNSAYDPAFRPVVPISRRLEAPAPIVVTDQAYFHRATLERLSTLQSMCASGNQAVVSRLSKRLVAFQRELGPDSDGIYIKGVFTERRSLKRLVDAQFEIKDMSEVERDWQAPLWPVEVRTVAQDLCEIVQDLLDNDEQTKTLEQAPDDGALSEEDTKLPAAARALEQDLLEDVAEDLVDESVPSVIENYIDQADDAVRTTKPGEAPLDRPIGGLRGVLLNLGNAIAEATLSALETAGTVTKKGGRWVVAAAASGYIGNTTIPWAIARLSTLRDALATQAWDDVIAFLSNILI